MRSTAGGRVTARLDALGTPRRYRSAGRGGAAPLIDPAVAVERELPSLRIDLDLSAEQAALFNSFERQVRNTAEPARVRVRHLSTLCTGDGSIATADAVLGTIVDDDAERADAAHLALDRMALLYAALTLDQRKQSGRRIVQSIREPFGGT